MSEKIDKELFGRRLKELINKYNETTYSLSKVVNLSPPTISRYARSEMVPKMTTIEILANHFNINPKWLAGQSNSIFEREVLDELDSTVSIPVFKNINYHLPLYSNEKTRENLILPIDLLSKWGAIISVKAPDDSMNPLIKKGDKLVIKLGDVTIPNQLTALHINEEDMIIRKVIKKDKQYILQPANFDYDSEIYTVGKDDVQIIGKVVYSQSQNVNLFEE